LPFCISTNIKKSGGNKKFCVVESLDCHLKRHSEAIRRMNARWSTAKQQSYQAKLVN